MINVRDKTRIVAIRKHCLVVDDVMKEINRNYDKFLSREMYKSAIIYSISQIGENANYLSKNFIEENKSIPWKNIIRTRSIMVHHYDKIDYSVIWDICINDIDKLEKFINKIIEEENIDTEYETLVI